MFGLNRRDQRGQRPPAGVNVGRHANRDRALLQQFLQTFAGLSIDRDVWQRRQPVDRFRGRATPDWRDDHLVNLISADTDDADRTMSFGWRDLWRTSEPIGEHDLSRRVDGCIVFLATRLGIDQLRLDASLTG